MLQSLIPDRFDVTAAIIGLIRIAHLEGKALTMCEGQSSG